MLVPFWPIDVTKPYQSIGFGAIDVTKPFKFIGFWGIDVTTPYKLIGFGAIVGVIPGTPEPPEDSPLTRWLPRPTSARASRAIDPVTAAARLGLMLSLAWVLKRY